MTDPKDKNLSDYLTFAAELAREAGRITLNYYRRGVAVETKADNSPVTIADRETEQFIRQRIQEAWPDHGILGEEFDAVRPDAPWRWVIDPIDGTKSFVHGVPLYTVLLALEHEGEPVVGVIHNPPQDETVAAAIGLGCTYNGDPCRVSETEDLAKAWVHSTDFSDLLRRRPAFGRALIERAGFTRTWADGYGYLLVACGRADVMVDPVVNRWDWSALKPVILEAGGRFTDMDGDPSIKGENVIAANPKLHQQVLNLVEVD